MARDTSLVILTAGISLLENLKNPDKLNKPESLDNLQYEEAGAWHTFLSDAVKSRPGDALRTKLAKFADLYSPLSLENDKDRQSTTAEIASVYLMRMQDLAQEIHLVILCSDTGRGAFCGLVNAMLLAKEVRCFRTFKGYMLEEENRYDTVSGFCGESEIYIAEELATVRLPKIDLIVVDKLNPKDPDLFEKKALPNLIGSIANLHYGRPDTLYREQPTVINYSGGYKAAIPTLTQAVAVAGNIDMTCLYEEGTRLIEDTIIPLSLPDDVKGRLLNAKSGIVRDIPLVRALDAEERPFYQDSEAGCTLSPLGRSVQIMLQAEKSFWEKRNQV